MDLTQALLESAIEIQEAALKNAADNGARAPIQKRIEALTNLLEQLFREPEPVELTKEQLEKLFDRLKRVAGLR